MSATPRNSLWSKTEPEKFLKKGPMYCILKAADRFQLGSKLKNFNIQKFQWDLKTVLIYLSLLCNGSISTIFRNLYVPVPLEKTKGIPNFDLIYRWDPFAFWPNLSSKNMKKVTMKEEKTSRVIPAQWYKLLLRNFTLFAFFCKKKSQSKIVFRNQQLLIKPICFRKHLRLLYWFHNVVLLQQGPKLTVFKQ